MAVQEVTILFFRTALDASNGFSDAVITQVPVNDPTLTFSLNRSTGIFTGNFEHTDTTRSNFSGIIFPRGVNAGGWGFFLTKPLFPMDYMGESGAVDVNGQ